MRQQSFQKVSPLTDNGGPRQIQLTVSPALDHALKRDWDAFAVAAAREKPGRFAAWLARRLERPEIAGDLEQLAQDLLAADVDRQAIAAVELAEMAEVTDDALAEMLWNGALTVGLSSADGDLVFEATARLAEIAEMDGDPLAVAEYFVDFLNWRRQSDHASDPDAVHEAFEGIIRSAEADDRPEEAARFEFQQARYGRIVEGEGEGATVGDWQSGEPTFTAWND